MGTSTSSSGPGSGVSFDPPWLDELVPAAAGGESETPLTNEPAQPADFGDDESHDKPEGARPAIAPPRRFAAARRDLGAFVRSGDTDRLARAVGHYARTGMGGAAKATSRMRASTSAGAGLVSLLQVLRPDLISTQGPKLCEVDFGAASQVVFGGAQACQ